MHKVLPCWCAVAKVSNMSFDIENEYDVVIVGCGPAGSGTAKMLAEKGISVIALDRNNEIGAPKRCGEGLSANSVKRLGLKIPRQCIAHDIEGAVAYAPNGKKITVKFAGTKGHVLERKMFDKWLAGEAARAGAKIIAKSNVYDLIKNNGYISGVKADIMGDKVEIKSRVVVAADGAESTIMRMAGFRGKNPRLVDTGFQYEMDGIDIEKPDMIHLYFGNKIAYRGYVWIFPKGKSRANVGIGISGLGSTKTAKQFLDEWIASKKELSKGSIIEVNAGCIPVGGLLENMVGNGLVGVGDAVSQVNPIHGGGIAESLKASCIAADVIAEAVRKNDVSAKQLSAYNKIWWKECGERLKRVEKVRELFEKMSDDELNDLAEVLSGEDLADMAHGKNILKVAKLYAKLKAKGIKRRIGL